MIHPMSQEELLSRYLDGDLPEVELRRLEGVLEADEAVRRRLEGMQRVVDELDALPRQRTPASLGDAVRRRIAADSPSRRWLDRVERGLQRLVMDSPLPATFAVVLALAVSFYLLAHGVARRAQDSTSLIVAPTARAEGGEGAPIRSVDGRRFRLVEGRWWEEGVETAGEPALRGDGLREWLVRHPEDGALARLGGDVVVAGEGGGVVLGFGGAGS